jgi:predicted phosphate transport protein (TIGR00153 family)
MTFKIIPLIGKQRKNDTLMLIRDLVEHLDKSNKNFRDALKYWLDDDYDNLALVIQRVKEIENNADDVTEKIIMQLYSGAFALNTRSAVHDLVKAKDKIIDAITKTVSLFWFMQDKKFREEYKSEFWKLGNMVKDSVDRFLLVMNDMLDKNPGLMDHLKEARELERKCDILEHNIMELAYFGKKEAITNTLLARIANSMSGIADAVDTASQKVVVLKLQKRL